MIVHRRTFNIKRGRMQEAVTLIKGEQARIQRTYARKGTVRNYISYVGPVETLVLEVEWESVAEWDQFWRDWGDSPEKNTFQAKWLDVTEPGGALELWELV